MSLPTLKNTYYLIRHSLSESNVQNIYSTNPDLGPTQHPLVPEGRELALQSITAEASKYHLNQNTIIVSSPFLRTRQTAEIVAEHLHCQPPTFDSRLVERYCGDFDNKVYVSPPPHLLADTDINSHYHNVENLQTVWDRMTGVIHDLEKQHQNQTIIIVSHGDPLNILYCGWHEIDLRQHATYFPKFKNAEIRPLL